MLSGIAYRMTEDTMGATRRRARAPIETHISTERENPHE
jgi:hypothetical protein